MDTQRNHDVPPYPLIERLNRDSMWSLRLLVYVIAAAVCVIAWKAQW